jgi:hypothetical protein
VYPYLHELINAVGFARIVLRSPAETPQAKRAVTPGLELPYALLIEKQGGRRHTEAR